MRFLSSLHHAAIFVAVIAVASAAQPDEIMTKQRYRNTDTKEDGAKKEQSYISKIEAGFDEFIGLAKRRPGMATCVFLILAVPVAYVVYRDRAQLAKVRDQVVKAEERLDPLLPDRGSGNSDTGSPTDQKLESLLARLEGALKDAKYGLPPDTLEGSAAYYTTVRFFLDELQEGRGPKWHYYRLITSATKGMSVAVVPLARSRSFRAFLESAGVKVTVMTFDERKSRGMPGPHTGQVLAASNGPLLGPGSDPTLHYVLHPNLEFWVDERVLRALEEVHFEFKKLYTTTVRDVLNASRK